MDQNVLVLRAERQTAVPAGVGEYPGIAGVTGKFN